jgi:phosphatidate cytidylyltransferase
VLFILVLAIQVLAIQESAQLFRSKNITVHAPLLIVLSLSTSILVYFSPLIAFAEPSATPILAIFISLVFGNLILLSKYAFSRKESFIAIIQSVSAEVFIFFYCGILGSFLVYITSCFPLHAEPVFVFTLLTFSNDSLAWFFGMTFGKKRGIVDVSPSKSVAGFFGGFFGSIAVGVLSYFLFPWFRNSSIIPVLFLSACMGIAVILGDLVESALKRSSGVKDSSSIVPGRGGVLDSFDSLLFSAPVFVGFSILFHFFTT